MARRPTPFTRPRKSLLADHPFDAKRAPLLARRRTARLKDIGVATPYGGDAPPWLWLDALHPYVEGKGWLELFDPMEVGRRWDTLVPVATFDGIFERQKPSSFEIVRPTAWIHIDPPGRYLVDISLWGNCHDQPVTAFKIFAEEEQVIKVDKAKDDQITVISNGHVIIHLDIPHDGQVKKTGGWALNGVRVTPI